MKLLKVIVKTFLKILFNIYIYFKSLKLINVNLSLIKFIFINFLLSFFNFFYKILIIY